MWSIKHHSKKEAVPELQVIHDHLLANCLCTLPTHVSPLVVRHLFSGEVLRSDVTANWSVDQILLQVTCVQLICEKVIKQSANVYRCRTLADLFNDLSRRQHNVIEYLVDLGDDTDMYIRFAASGALVAFFLVLKTRLDRNLLDKLVERIECRSRPHRISFALDVLKRIVEWKDFEEHVLEDTPATEDERPPTTCHVLSMHAERMDSTQVKCICIESLASKWTTIVKQFTTLIRDNCAAVNSTNTTSSSSASLLSSSSSSSSSSLTLPSPTWQPPSQQQQQQQQQQTTSTITMASCVFSFLSLWEAIISVKANLSIIDTKPFYCSLDTCVSLLSNNTSSLVWKHILNLFNEVLCYGSTLALQHDLPEEPCSLAHIVVRNVKDKRLLRMVPHIIGNGSFGGNGNCNAAGDKVLLRKIVLMILKAVAVTVKEAKYDSSSDSSAGSEPEDVDRDMDVICRSIYDVLKRLDTFVKENEDFLPSTRLATWIVHLFMDQDDYLVESMVCCVDVARVLCYRNNFFAELRKDLNPSETFLTFATTTSFNVDLLVDYLKSNETCFLLYALNFLKYVRDHWGEFVHTCRYEMQAVSKLFSDLRRTIEKEVRSNQITYNINPVLTLLVDCEQRFRII